jgi:hypothetical protein
METNIKSKVALITGGERRDWTGGGRALLRRELDNGPSPRRDGGMTS